MKCLACAVLLAALLPASAFAEDLSKCLAGWDAAEAGDHQHAIALFDTCIKDGRLSDASLARTYRNMGIAYRNAKAPEKAIAAYNKAIAMHPDDVVSDYINRANAYDDAGQFDRAMADYAKALELSPDEGEVYYNRGIAYEHNKMFEKARADFVTAYSHGLRMPLLHERLVVYGLIKPN